MKNKMSAAFALSRVITLARIHEADRSNKHVTARGEFQKLFPADHQPDSNHPRKRRNKTRDDLVAPQYRIRRENINKRKKQEVAEAAE